MKNPKYKLIRAGYLQIHRSLGSDRFYRIQALRDIPEHGVKAGDLGGYVTWRKSLSHEGSCWVADTAQIVGKVRIRDNAYIGDQAVVQRRDSSGLTCFDIEIAENARITGFAHVSSHRIVAMDPRRTSSIRGDAHIYGKAKVRNAHEISGNVKIYDDASVTNATSISGNTDIFGNATIASVHLISGDTKIFESAKIEDDAEIVNSVIAGSTHIMKTQRVIDGKFNETKIGATLDSLIVSGRKEPSMTAVAPTPVPGAAKENASLRALKDVEANIASYETDIVKIIKYPVMTDRTNPFTQEMVLTLNIAKRLADDPDTIEFKDAMKDLERSFLAAESNALKVASTLLSDEEKKKTEKARDLLAIAENESSSEQEKKVSFKQAFKQLEGVLAVPEVAVDTFRVKIGLKEIEG